MKIFPLGEFALTVEFGREMDADINQRAIELSERMIAAPFPGMIEAAPAIASATVYFDPEVVKRSHPGFRTAFDAVRSYILNALDGAGKENTKSQRQIRIPVHFDAESAPDIEEALRLSGLERGEFLSIFLGREYRVYMLGFLPGFAYMGTVDVRIALPRKTTPRHRVARGSVGIAGRQTGIYPLESPGGWQIIGRTSMEMFLPEGDEPFTLRPGDLVRFVDADR